MKSIQDQITKAQQTNQLSSPILSPGKTDLKEFYFRVLPYIHNPESPFIEVYTHNNIGKNKNNFALCPKQMFGEECKYCDAGEKLRNDLSKEEWKEVGPNFYSTRSVYIPGFVRGKTPEFYFLKVSAVQNFDKEIIGILTNSELKGMFGLGEKDFVKIWELVSGLDLKVTVNPKTDKQKNKTFTIGPSLLGKSKAVTNQAEKDLIEKYLKNREMPDLVQDMVKAWGSKEKIDKVFESQYKDSSTTSTKNTNVKTTSETSTPTTGDVIPENVEYDTSFDEVETTNPSEESKVTSTDDDYDSLMAELSGN
jgi:hypothetical protein